MPVADILSSRVLGACHSIHRGEKVLLLREAGTGGVVIGGYE